MPKYGAVALLLSVLAPIFLLVQTLESCQLGGFSLGRGKQLYLLKINSANNCSKTCKSVPICTHWSFDSSKNFCILSRDDPNNKILIRKHEPSVSAAQDCSSTLLLTNKGYSCFAGGWVISASISDQKEVPRKNVESFLTAVNITSSPEKCQRLCQEAHEDREEKRCALWEWTVSSEQCRLWGSGVIVRRLSDRPLGLSAFTSPLDKQEKSSDTSVQNKSPRLKKFIESMRAFVGPRFCPDAATVEPTNDPIRQIEYRDTCPLPKIRHFPWVNTTTRYSAYVKENVSSIVDPNKGDDGIIIRTNGPQEFISKGQVLSLTLQDSRFAYSQVLQEALDSSTIFSGISVGFDSRSTYLDAVTDRTENVRECQQLCKNTRNCSVFTFYFDGRSGANCLLKNTVKLSQLFDHPVAITGDTKTTDSLVLSGMKLGYEMKGTTIAVPAEGKAVNVSTFTFRNQHLISMYVEQNARESCKQLGVDGWAVIDYYSRTAHAVAAAGAVERYMPMFNYISCSNIL